jgi:hypothetical protein
VPEMAARAKREISTFFILSILGVKFKVNRWLGAAVIFLKAYRPGSWRGV